MRRPTVAGRPRPATRGRDRKHRGAEQSTELAVTAVEHLGLRSSRLASDSRSPLVAAVARRRFATETTLCCGSVWPQQWRGGGRKRARHEPHLPDGGRCPQACTAGLTWRVRLPPGPASRCGLCTYRRGCLVRSNAGGCGNHTHDSARMCRGNALGELRARERTRCAFRSLPGKPARRVIEAGRHFLRRRWPCWQRLCWDARRRRTPVSATRPRHRAP